MPKHYSGSALTKSLAQKISEFAYDALFLAGAGFVGLALTILLSSTETIAIRAAKVVLVISWLCFAAAVRKASFFEHLGSNRRALGDAVLSLIIAVVIVGGYAYLPWQQAPKLYTTGFSPILAVGAEPAANVEILNDSEYDNSSMNIYGEMRLIPYQRNIESRAPEDTAAVMAMDESVSAEIFKSVDNSPNLRDLPHRNGLSPHVKSVYTIGMDHVLTSDEIREHEEGKLIIFIGGRIKYKDVNGCVYKSDFCGFWGKSTWLMAHCHTGHFEQGIRLKDKCQVD